MPCIIRKSYSRVPDLPDIGKIGERLDRITASKMRMRDRRFNWIVRASFRLRIQDRGYLKFSRSKIPTP